MLRKTLVLAGLPLLAVFILSRSSFMLENPSSKRSTPQQSTTSDEDKPKEIDSVIKRSHDEPPLQQLRQQQQQQQQRQEEEKRNISIVGQQQQQQQEQGKRNISIVVRLRGEMANHLSLLAFAKGIQLWIHDHYPTLKVELFGERQSGLKWKGAVTSLQQCFFNLRDLEFHGGRWDEQFRRRSDQQIAWVGEQNHSQHLIIDRGDSDCGSEGELFCLNDQLAFFRQLLAQDIPGPIFSRNQTDQQNRYSLPFLISNQLASFDVLVDQYYDQLKEWLAFDFEACCTQVQPQKEEVVFHLRNFRAEMRERNYLERGYEELTPNQLANELLGHLPKGTSIAIASRGETYVDSFVNALKHRGFIVRLTPTNHSGVQDFCFLLKTQRELVGTLRSTYTRWAALLGDAKQVQLYSIDSPWTRRAHGNEDTFPTSLHYQWKRRELQTRIQYSILKSSLDGS